MAAAATPPPSPLIVLGGGGHARVLLETLQRLGRPVLGFTDPRPPPGPARPEPWLGDDSVISGYPPQDVQLLNGLGGAGDTGPRQRLFEYWCQRGYRFARVIHPAAVVAGRAVRLGPGVQILAGAVVGPGVSVGENALLNTRTVVEHDCWLGDHVHVASGAVLCGGCRIEAGAHIGAGATLIQGCRVGAGALVAAGATVVRDVEPMTLVAGVPATFRKRLSPG